MGVPVLKKSVADLGCWVQSLGFLEVLGLNARLRRAPGFDFLRVLKGLRFGFVYGL